VSFFAVLLENLSGDACSILTTYSLKNSTLTCDLIHSRASMSGATSSPAHLVNVFPLPTGLNVSPSFNCENVRAIHLPLNLYSSMFSSCMFSSCMFSSCMFSSCMFFYFFDLHFLFFFALLLLDPPH
jgi:hypothetical protein